MKYSRLLLFLFLVSCNKNPLGGTAGGNAPTNHNPYLAACTEHLKIKGYNLSNAKIGGSIPNCTFSCESSYKLSSDNKSCSALISFSEDYSLSLLGSTFDALSIQESGGIVSLKPSVLTSVATDHLSSGETDLGEGFLDSNLHYSSDKISLLAATGEYKSVAFNSLSNQVLTEQFFYSTSLPFGKELVTTPETGYGSPVFNFSDGLRALWHFNESSFPIGSESALDSKGSNHGTISNVVLPTSGKFNSAVSLNSSTIKVLDSPDLDGTSKFTASFWVYPQILDGEARAVMSKRINTTATNNSYSFFFFTQNRLHIDFGGSDNRFSTNTIFQTDRWYHVAITFDGALASTQRVSVYVNGVLDKTTTESSASVPNSTADLFFGTMNLNDGRYYRGKIDEVAIWHKTLTPDNVKELYRRGANRVKIQVRTCNQESSKDCAGVVSSWVGVDGSNSSYFSEANNLQGSGNLSNLPYASPWSLFPNLLTWQQNNMEKYIQFRAVFESDTNLFYPDLISAGFTPSPRYAVSSIVSPAASKALSFYKINKIQTEEECADKDANPLSDKILYDLTTDGTNYLVFDSSQWVSSPSPSLTKSQIDTITQDQWNMLPQGSLSLRYDLTSSGLSSCALKRIRVQGQRE